MSTAITTNSDYITLTAPATTQAFTFELWTYFYALPASNGIFQTIWSIDDNASSFTQLYVVNNGGTQTYGFTPIGGFDITFTTGITAATWFRTVIVQTPGVAGGTFYLGTGNSPLRKVTTAVGGQNNPDTTIYIGNERAIDQNINGEMAGLKIWERVLTEPEIIAQGRQLAPINRTGLRYYLPFTSKQAPNVRAAGWGSNGTVTGTPGFTSRMPPVPEYVSSKTRFLETLRGPTGTTVDVFVYEGMSLVESF